MKKRFLIIGLLFLSFSAIAQEFSYKRVFVNNQKLKMKGFVKVTDSTITIITNRVPATFKVSLKQKTNISKVLVHNEKSTNDFSIRFTLAKTSVSKKETWTLLMETKDQYSGSIGSMVYPLIPLKN